jgi:signal transduction histidine kinase
MPRGEFATFRTEVSPAPAAAREPSPPPPAADRPTPTRHQSRAQSGLRVLLVDRDAQSAATIRGLLNDAFGGRSVSDWMSDWGQGVELMQKHEHDVYLCADTAGSEDAIAFVRAGVDSHCPAPIIVLAQNADAEADLSSVDAGAADYLPKEGLTPAALERSIRHALFHQQRAVEARREIEGLTAEKTQLHLLREANHRFVENACHDFRSPLTVIKEFAAIIEEGLAGDVNEEQSEFLGIILTRVDQLSQMVDGILDASRLESDVIGVRREERDVAALIDAARPTLKQLAAAHKVEIEFAVPEGLPKVFADSESIGRVIVNLGANACKYAGEGGKIQVWARYSEEQKRVTVGVTDSGPGIAPDHVKLIFDRFHQIPSDKQQNKGGFGLGLHIASEFVRVNYGTLTVESEPKKGSTFAFTLPIFDVDSLIPLHFAFLKTSRHSFEKVSIALATTDAGPDSPALAEVERLLNRQLRSYDLLLKLRPGNWLVGIACEKEDISQVTDRIRDSYLQSNRNRPDGPLPDVRFRPVGTWALANRPEGLRDAISGVYARSPEGREIH